MADHTVVHCDGSDNEWLPYQSNGTNSRSNEQLTIDHTQQATVESRGSPFTPVGNSHRNNVSDKPMAAPRKSTNITGKRKLEGATVSAAKRANPNISTYFLPSRTTRRTSDLRLLNTLFKDPVELLQHLTKLSAAAEPGSDDHRHYLDMLGKPLVILPCL